MNRSVTSVITVLTCAVFFFGGCSNETASTEPAEVEVHLTAMGMHCDGCKQTIETTFMKLPGVDSVYADWQSKDVYVKVDTTKTSYSRLEDLISELGFDEMFDDQEGM